MVKYLWRTQSSSVSEICPHPWVDWQCAQSIPLDQPHTDWATSANRGTTLKRIFEGPSHYGSEAKLAKLASWPQRIPLASFPLALPFPLRFLSSILITGKPAQHSPSSIRLCCTGCTPHPDRYYDACSVTVL